MSTTPYATIIIPTHDRSSTLSYSIQSALNQSIDNIEVLIVLDGATEACKDIAYAYQQGDERVKVMDYPKSPGGGQDNVHRAILESNSDRIFYNDDDDILLVDHVEKLGTVLDNADIVDSRVASVDRNQSLHLTPTNGSSSVMKELLLKGQLKSLFDSHIAHRKTPYLEFTGWKDQAPDGKDCVWQFFSFWCRQEGIRWESIPDVTALSIHGANRRDMSEQERAYEIKQWLKIASDQNLIDEKLRQANRLFHFFRLQIRYPASGMTYENYLSHCESYKDLYSDVCVMIFFS